MPRGLIAMTRCGGVVSQVCKLGVHVLSNFRMLAMRLRSAEILRFFIRPNRRSCARSALASPNIRTDPSHYFFITGPFDARRLSTSSNVTQATETPARRYHEIRASSPVTDEYDSRGYYPPPQPLQPTRRMSYPAATAGGVLNGRRLAVSAGTSGGRHLHRRRSS